MDGEAWCAVVNEVAKSLTWLSNWTDLLLFSKVLLLFFFSWSFYLLNCSEICLLFDRHNKENHILIFFRKYAIIMTHIWASQVALVVRIHLQCRGCGFDSWAEKTPWRRKRQPALVFLPWKFLRQRSLAGYSSWDCKNQIRHTHTHTYIAKTFN